MGMESKYQGIQVFWLWTFIGFVIWPIYDFIKQILLQLFYFLTLSWSLPVWYVYTSIVLFAFIKHYFDALNQYDEGFIKGFLL